MENKMDLLLDAVNEKFPKVLSTIMGDADEGEELFFDGGNLNDEFAFSVILGDSGEYVLSVHQESGDYLGGDSYVKREERTYKTAKGLVNYVAKTYGE